MAGCDGMVILHKNDDDDDDGTVPLSDTMEFEDTSSGRLLLILGYNLTTKPQGTVL